MDARANYEADALSSKRGKAWRDWAILLWIILGVAASAKVLVQPTRHTTYPIFSEAARHWWADESLYGEAREQNQYRYSPTFAIAMSPFGLLPDRFGGVLWNVASIVLLVWSLRLLVREVLPGSWPAWREAALLTLTFVGSIRGIWSGQTNAVLLAIVFLALAAIRRQKWWTAAWLLSATVFIKIWPVALILLLAACWPRQLIWRTVLVSVPLALVPFLTRPFHVVCQQYGTWFHFLAQIEQLRWPGYRDAWTIWEQCFPPVNPQAYQVLQLATAAAVLGWCLWQRRRLGESGALLMAIVSMWASWQLLFGPGSERLTYLILAPSASWAVLASWQARRLRFLAVSAWLMLGGLGTGGFERAVVSVLPIAPAILPLGGAVFVLWLVSWETGPKPAEAVAQLEPPALTDEALHSHLAAAHRKTPSLSR